jgi:hypothetical protein
MVSGRPTPHANRDWPWLEPGLFFGTLTLYLLALPLGLDRIASAPAVTAAATLWSGAPASRAIDSPLATLVTRLFAFLPLGDFATRANLASAVMVSLAMALVGRVIAECLRSLRPPAKARTGPRDFAHEPAAAATGAALVALSLGVFRSATGAGDAGATLAVVATGWLLIMRLSRAPQDGTTGACLALLAGLAVGTHPLAPLMIWPPTFLLWLWALRRAERWTLLAPLLFAAGLGILLAPLARTPATLFDLVARSVSAGGRGSLEISTAASALAHVKEAGEQIGAVGILITTVGFGVLLIRAPFGFCVAAASLALAIFASGAGTGARLLGRPDEAGAAFALLLFGFGLPTGVGASFMAGKLGLARLPAACVLAIVALVSPLLDGGGERWRRDTRLPARLLERGLEGTPLAGQVEPGTPEMAALFRYARALGLRPDIRLVYGKMPRSE